MAVSAGMAGEFRTPYIDICCASADMAAGREMIRGITSQRDPFVFATKAVASFSDHLSRLFPAHSRAEILKVRQ